MRGDGVPGAPDFSLPLPWDPSVLPLPRLGPGGGLARVTWALPGLPAQRSPPPAPTSGLVSEAECDQRVTLLWQPGCVGTHLYSACLRCQENRVRNHAI